MANHPHDASRPPTKAVQKALKTGNMAALELALTPRQRAFCKEYVVDFNGAAAVVRAGYSPNHPDKQAYQLKQNPGIAAYIDHLVMSKEAKINSVSPDYVIQQVTSIIHKEGAKDGDKLRALELLARHLGMFIDRTEITGKDGEALQIEQRVREEADSFINTIRRISDKNKDKNLQ